MNEIHPQNSTHMRSALSKFISNNVIYLPTILTIFLILGIWILNELFVITNPLNKFLFALVLLSLMGTDILYIWRREMPGLIPGRMIRGKMAIIGGIFELVLLLFIGFFFLAFRNE